MRRRPLVSYFNPMNTLVELRVSPGERAEAINIIKKPVGKMAWRLELALFVVPIILLNLPLLSGRFADSFMFVPAAVQAGEWWRLFTHPFVHVSWYHLLLDVTAFFMTYAELRHRGWLERFGLVVGAGAGGLLAAWCTAPVVLTHGLCGLSGIAHGLMAVAGLELTQSRDRLLRGLGLASFGGVVIKCLIEALTGEIVFASWHLGWLGTPVAVCHAGGVVGALLPWLILRAKRPGPL